MILAVLDDLMFTSRIKTAASQLYGACIMSVCSALMEERVMDQQTGRVLNAEGRGFRLRPKRGMPNPRPDEMQGAVRARVSMHSPHSPRP